MASSIGSADPFTFDPTNTIRQVYSLPAQKQVHEWQDISSRQAFLSYHTHDEQKEEHKLYIDIPKPYLFSNVFGMGPLVEAKSHHFLSRPFYYRQNDHTIYRFDYFYVFIGLTLIWLGAILTALLFIMLYRKSTHPFLTWAILAGPFSFPRLLSQAFESV